MILHFSHIGFTDGRTFTLASLSVSSRLMSSFGSALATASGRRYQAEDAPAAQDGRTARPTRDVSRELSLAGAARAALIRTRRLAGRRGSYVPRGASGRCEYEPRPRP